VFVILGLTTGALGSWLVRWQDELAFGLGIVVILLGLAFAGWLPFFSQREWRIHQIPSVGLAAAPVIGFLFGLGWTPCLGPTLAAIQLLAFNEATAERGALLSGVYALGLGIPFIVAALLYRRALGAFAWVRRHQVWVMRAGGLMLVAVGLLLVTGFWNDMVQWLQVHLILGTETPV
jgi:cytochrome c-type biogenesis protein